MGSGSKDFCVFAVFIVDGGFMLLGSRLDVASFTPDFFIIPTDCFVFFGCDLVLDIATAGFDWLPDTEAASL